MTEISVATWNLHQGVDRRQANMDRTWQYLRDEVSPTVALVQEAFALPAVGGGAVSPDPAPMRYRTAVIGYAAKVAELPEIRTRYSTSTPFTIKPTLATTLAVAQVFPADVDPLVAVSLYGRMAPLYAQTSVLVAAADLIPLFDDLRFRDRIVVGGDFNAYDQTGDMVMRDRWRAILAVFESLGLVNLAKATRVARGPLIGCVCRELDCYHVTTFIHRRAAAGSIGLMADYLFASPALASRLISFEVLADRPEVWEMSDHAPLVARFDV